MRVACRVVSNAEGAGARSRGGGGESHHKGAKRARVHRTAAIVGLGKITCCCDTSDAQRSAARVLEGHRLGRAGGPHCLRGKSEARRRQADHWDASCAGQRELMRAARRIVGDRDRARAYSRGRGSESHAERTKGGRQDAGWAVVGLSEVTAGNDSGDVQALRAIVAQLPLLDRAGSPHRLRSEG